MERNATPEDKDPALWQMARKRAEFKLHLRTFIIINGLLWILWAISDGRDYDRDGLPWPVWPLMGWGIALVFHFLDVYGNTKSSLTEKEYEKLANRNNGRKQ